MSAELPLVVHEGRVGHRIVRFTAQSAQVGKASSLIVEWEPDEPQTLSRKELRAYQRERSKLLVKMATALNEPVLCVEL